MSSFKSFIFFLLVFVTNINCQVSKRFFRKDYTYLLSTDNFYKIHTVPRTWGEAKVRCAMEGAKLFYPQDANEAEAVIRLSTETQPFNLMFVGFTKAIAKDVFETIDDDVYKNWAPGEPNEQDEQEVCVVSDRDGRLNDERCDRKYPFICKKMFADLEWNFDCDMPNKDYKFEQQFRKCYKFHLTPKNWTEASTTCSAEQSYLAIIESQAEADYLVKMTADAPKNKVTGDFMSGAVHLGFHNKNSEGWKTVKGVPLSES
ncbi:secretory phospholipase A2 receptor-like isoform X2 [Hyposmocoma kahamanoa]|uniref:secretory phospholipase A2 receptor-like isoform X2 n=1 Tax=Hyposmocoma kahamanoa TaxID=1477025 RepID=UPI000E6D6459|nr:secretory phospholipase A2 receptor-like isoform X2 [Hyposmocoma kahamanoa]